MKSLRIALALLLAFAPATAAYAGVPFSQIPTGKAAVMYYQDVDGTYVPVSAANPAPSNASATISGWPGSSQSTGTPFTADTNAETGTLPAGAVVVVSNSDADTSAYCKLGASATVNDKEITPKSWFAFTVGSATQITCITAADTAVMKMSGGAGIPTGAGGGSSAAGGGDASAANQTTQITAEQAIQAALGAKTDAKNSATDATSISMMQVLKQLSAYLAAVQPPAIDAAIAGQTPSTVACQRLNAAPTAATTATTGPFNCNVLGYTVTTPYALSASFVSGITASMTGTTSTAVTGMGAPGANLFNYITTVVCGNSDATVGTFVDLQDGNGGTVFATFPAAAVYGGAAVNLPVPLKQPTANTALYAVPKTTSSETVCTVIGFKGP